jgi:hypothetical protein
LAARHLVKLRVQLARLEFSVGVYLFAAFPPVGICAGELLLAGVLLADLWRLLFAAFALLYLITFFLDWAFSCVVSPC